MTRRKHQEPRDIESGDRVTVTLAGSKYTLTLYGPVKRILLSESLRGCLEKDSYFPGGKTEAQRRYNDNG